jgi:hypothetical protein
MQVGKWSLRNFGTQGAHRPAMGMVEELCELYAALEGNDQYEVSDAIGDTIIYMADYFYNRGWSLGDAWLERERSTEDTAATTLRLIGKLCHSHLKGEQGIRGGKEKHDAAMKLACSRVLGLLDEVAEDHLNRATASVVQDVWAVVSQRDWTQNPVNAHEVAAAPSGRPLDNPNGGEATKDALQQIIDEGKVGYTPMAPTPTDKVQINLTYEVGDDDDGGA